MKYTYVVEHGNDNPRISAKTIIMGGELIAVMFDDALRRLEEIEIFLHTIRDETTDNQTKYSIDEFMS